jgi:valyl-tRNA synthetase
MDESKKADGVNPEKKKKAPKAAPAPVFVNKTPKGEKKG